VLLRENFIKKEKYGILRSAAKEITSMLYGLLSALEYNCTP
jgi:hypothetical protein